MIAVGDFIFTKMINLYKLQEAMIWIHGAFKDEDKVLGEAIGIDGMKLQLLADYDVDVVFPPWIISAMSVGWFFFKYR